MQSIYELAIKFKVGKTQDLKVSLMNTQDYFSIDECIRIEDLWLKIEDIINDGFEIFVDEEHDVEQDVDDDISEVKITLKETL